MGAVAHLRARELARLLLSVLGRHGTNATRVGPTLVLARDAERSAAAVVPARREQLGLPALEGLDMLVVLRTRDVDVWSGRGEE